jgi:hypothetical protein
VHLEDDTLQPALQSLVVTYRQPRAPIAAMHYDVVGCAPYAVLEEGDRAATGLSAGEVVTTIAERCRARLLDHLSLGGWVAARAGIAWIDGRRALVLGDEERAVTTRLRATGHVVEGDELVFFRDGEAVCLPQPCSPRVELRPVDSVVLVSDPSSADGSAPLNTADIVQALLGATVTALAPSGKLVAACVALVAHARARRL